MSERKMIVGSWDLLSFETRLSSGEIRHPYGEDAVGRLMYDAEGHMSAHLMRRGRPEFDSDDQLKGTDGEIRPAFEGCVSYYGDYEVREGEGVVVHHVRGSLFPNWEGGEQVRFFDLADGKLTLTTPRVAFGGGEVTAVLVWKRSEQTSPATG